MHTEENQVFITHLLFNKKDKTHHTPLQKRVLWSRGVCLYSVAVRLGHLVPSPAKYRPLAGN